MKSYKKIFFALLIAFVSVPFAASAATLVDTASSFGLLSEPVLDDAYVASNQVSVSGEIGGDLLAAGASVTVTGPVESDLMIASGSAVVKTEIGDDVRIVAGNVVLDSSVQGDVVVAGGQVLMLPTSTINGDLIITAGAVTVAGTIQGEVRLMGGEVSVNALIGEDLSVNSEILVVGAETKITGDLKYYSKEPASISESAEIGGEVVIEEPAVSHEGRFFFGLFGFLQFIKVVGLLLGALLLSLLFKRHTNLVKDRALSKPASGVGIGFLGIFIIPIALVFVMATIIGLPIAMTGLFLYLFLLGVSGIYSGIILGAWLQRLVMKGNPGVDWKWTVIGTLLLSVLMLIPVVGWLAVLLVFWLTFGTFLRLIYAKVWQRRR